MIEKVTFWIAITGFGISVYNFIVERLSHRVNLDIEPIHVFNHSSKAFTLHLVIRNNSKDTLFIDQITIFNDGNEYDVGTQRSKLFELKGRTGADINEIMRWHSTSLPISIPPDGFIKKLFTIDATELVIKPNEPFELFVYTCKGLVQNPCLFTDYTDAIELYKYQEPDYQVRV